MLKKIVMKRNILFLVTFLCSFSYYSQNKIDNNYSKYFKLSREIPFLHLNKTTFLKGEEIWLKAYILNLKTNKLHKETTNLYCTIFDENGNQKDVKLLHIKNGLASGSFKIDSTFTSKNYFIKAHTKYMENFNEDESFLQKITILNNKQNSLKNETEIKYDFQILPEGGHLLEKTQNIIGIVIKDNFERGVKIKSGKILDSKNNYITNFTTNDVGLGRTKLFVESNENYSAEAVLENGEKLYIRKLNTKSNGVIVSVNNFNKKFINVIIKTNELTLKRVKNKEYTLLLHNTRTIIKKKIKFNENTTDYSFIINRKEIPYGTIITTLFDDKENPISERLIFNYNNSLFSKININQVKHNNDNLNIELLKANHDQIKYSLSASVLPLTSISYNPNNNIITKFLLAPYLKGKIENPSYYFHSTNREKLFKLDVLFLTQGWSKYNWNEIYNRSPQIKYPHEYGITIKGKLNKKYKDSTEILLFSKENDLVLNTYIVNDEFLLDKLYLKDSSRIDFSIKNKSKIRRSESYLQYFPIKPKKNKLNTSLFSQNNKSVYKNILLDNFILTDNILDTIVIKSKLSKNKPNIIGTYNTYKSSDLNSNGLRVLSFLKSKGFKINKRDNKITIQNNRNSANINNINNLTPIFLDGFQIQSNLNNSLDMIENSFVGDFEEIIISRTFGGEIHLYSDSSSQKARKSRFNNYTIPFGFSESKKYYTPKYIDVNNDSFRKFGAIYWEPNIEIDSKNISTNFKLPLLNQKEITIFIEGITEEGKLISTKKTITIE